MEIPFSLRLRRFEDYVGAQSKPWTNQERRLNVSNSSSATGLVRSMRHLMTLLSKAIRNQQIHLGLFEFSKMRNVARQSLLLCRQKEGEGDSVNAFTERLTRAVKGATVGLSEATIKNRLCWINS